VKYYYTTDGYTTHLLKKDRNVARKTIIGMQSEVDWQRFLRLTGTFKFDFWSQRYSLMLHGTKKIIYRTEVDTNHCTIVPLQNPANESLSLLLYLP
jgi:hypothetical protein